MPQPIRLINWAILIGLSLTGTKGISGQTADHGEPLVQVLFVPESGATLEQLSNGEPGSGVLVYYLAANGSERPSLIAHLDNSGREVVANVYDAPPGRGFVPYRMVDGEIIPGTNLGPAITITALDGYWVRDGLTNYNLDVQIYGPIYALWGPGMDPVTGRGGWTEEIGPGELAATIMVRDGDGDGFPDWDWRSLIPAFPGRGYYRTNYAEGKCASPLKYGESVSPEWPYVAGAGAFEQRSGELRPPIGVDWERGIIRHFSELVTVRNQNCSYSLYSINPLVPGQLNVTNFETPFAFYDLSGGGVGYPNLIVRTERYPPGDRWVGRPRLGFETIRYSWRDQVGDGRWDYKIDVAGNNPYTFTTPIAGGLTWIDAPDYESLPEWVVDQAWPVVTFVEAEGGSYRSSEGIYEYAAREVGDEYLSGRADEPDLRWFNQVRPGLRGEYRVGEPQEVDLYLSPIDGRLHLRGAVGGIYSLRDGQVLREKNLAGGAFIDGWVRESGIADEEGAGVGRFEEALYALPGHLLYQNKEELILLRSQYQAAIEEGRPPTDRASWLAFKKIADSPEGQGRDPTDLRAWLEAFDGERLLLAGIRLMRIEPEENGFRLTVEWDGDSEVRGSDWFDLAGRLAGVYGIEYGEDGYKIEAEGKSDVQMEVRLTQHEVQQVGQTAVVLVRAWHEGLSAGKVFSLTVEARQGEQVDILTSQTIEMADGVAVEVVIDWQPLVAGEWEIRARLADGESGSEEASTVASLVVEILESGEGSAVLDLGLLGWSRIAGLLLVIGLLAGGIAVIVSRPVG